MSDPVREFLHAYQARPVGDTPPQPLQPGGDAESEADERVEWDIEHPPGEWYAITVPEQPTRPGEYPERFIDGSQRNLPVLCVRPPQGWPVPLVVAEAGAIALRLKGRSFDRDFVQVERFLGMVAEPFPWDHVERFAGHLAAREDLRLRLTAANMPAEGKSPFDYDVMRNQTHQRLQQEMLNLERLALAAEPDVPALMDGMIGGTINDAQAARRPLLVGIVKRVTDKHLHDAGYRVLLDLRPGQRTPVMKLTGVSGEDSHVADIPRASWFLKLAGGPRLAPNWGFVRVDIPWVQFEQRGEDFGFINRLSRWLIDARCRTASYARMPVSLEPVVRAEDLLKPLFSPLHRVAGRLAHEAGGMP